MVMPGAAATVLPRRAPPACRAKRALGARLDIARSALPSGPRRVAGACAYVVEVYLGPYPRRSIRCRRRDRQTIGAFSSAAPLVAGDSRYRRISLDYAPSTTRAVRPEGSVSYIIESHVVTRAHRPVSRGPCLIIDGRSSVSARRTRCAVMERDDLFVEEGAPCRGRS